ncbi:MAG: hypothetical protein ABFS56_10405 [Pseudomonadota bacterium]
MASAVALQGFMDKLGMYPIQQSFDMITMLGFLVLIGTVVNNPILIHKENDNDQDSHGGIFLPEQVCNLIRNGLSIEQHEH